MNITMVEKMKNESQYTPCATYFHDSDCVEYVKYDAFTVYDRVDEFLTLIYDKTGKQLVGFKLKGFKNIFTQQLQPIFSLNDGQFLKLVSAIEAVCLVIGEKISNDDDRKRSYQAAASLAANDNVELRGTSIADLAA